VAAKDLPRQLDRLPASGIERKRLVGAVTTEILSYLTSAFTKKGFEWLLPVVFSRSTDPLWPDPGASIEKRIEVEIYGVPVRATLSMIIHKMVACSLAYPKLFLISPNVRIEKRDRAATGIHAYEFTQFDFEVRGASSRQIRTLVERTLVGLIGTLKRRRRRELAALARSDPWPLPSTPFRVHDRAALLHEYGEAWESRLAQEIRAPVWVTNIPREFYDYEDLQQARWDNYDLFLPRFGEVLSGARREWEHAKIRRKIRRDGVDASRYELLLRLAREEKLKPSAGAGIGLERLTAWLVGARHVGEVQPFPKVPGVVPDL
jgi:asparaginyl-tRNA synthetase